MKLIMENWRNYLSEEQRIDESVFGRFKRESLLLIAHSKYIMYKSRKKAKEFYSTKHLPQGPPSKRTEAQQREYRDLLDYKRDAFRHILANAWLGLYHNHAALKALGGLYELYGGAKNLTKQKKEWSGKDEDLKNNNLGLELSKKFIKDGITWEQACLEVKNIVDKGNFFIEFEDDLITYKEIEKYRDPIEDLDLPSYVDRDDETEIKLKRQ